MLFCLIFTLSFVPAGFMTTKQAVDLIHRYHGFASLAHPW